MIYRFAVDLDNRLGPEETERRKVDCRIHAFQYIGKDVQSGRVKEITAPLDDEYTLWTYISEVDVQEI